MGKHYATHSAAPRHSSNMVGIQLWGLAESHLISVLSLHVGEGSFSGSVSPDDTVNSESVVGIEPGDSGVVIGYQVDEFTHSWPAEHFIDSSHFILVSQVRCPH